MVLYSQFVNLALEFLVILGLANVSSATSNTSFTPRTNGDNRTMLNATSSSHSASWLVRDSAARGALLSTVALSQTSSPTTTTSSPLRKPSSFGYLSLANTIDVKPSKLTSNMTYSRTSTTTHPSLASSPLAFTTHILPTAYSKAGNMTTKEPEIAIHDFPPLRTTKNSRSRDNSSVALLLHGEKAISVAQGIPPTESTRGAATKLIGGDGRNFTGNYSSRPNDLGSSHVLPRFNSSSSDGHYGWSNTTGYYVNISMIHSMSNGVARAALCGRDTEATCKLEGDGFNALEDLQIPGITNVTIHSFASYANTSDEPDISDVDYFRFWEKNIDQSMVKEWYAAWTAEVQDNDWFQDKENMGEWKTFVRMYMNTYNFNCNMGSAVCNGILTQNELQRIYPGSKNRPLVRRILFVGIMMSKLHSSTVATALSFLLLGKRCKANLI